MLQDLRSRNGTFLGERRLQDTGLRLSHGARIRLGTLELTYLENEGRAIRAAAPPAARFVITHDLSIGRDPSCDIVLDDPAVSRTHAWIRPEPPAVLEFVGSRTSVDRRVNPRSVELREGTVVEIARFELRFEGGTVIVGERGHGQALRAEGVAVAVRDRLILQPVSLSVSSGEMMALIGPSGSGKTTLLKTLVGERSPNAGGYARLGHDPVSARGRDLGYVPQFETIHDRLTVDEVLRFAARMRLRGADDEEIDRRIDRVVAELQLGPHRDTWAGDLSGGQRKRLSCGIELIGSPRFLLLDEPTSGLDPALEHRFMQLLRKVADRGRGVMLTTHATSSIGMCDSLAVMEPGGKLSFVGSPEEALRHFGVANYDEIYSRIPDTAAPVPRSAAAPQDAPAAPARTRPRAEEGPGPLSQFALLTARYWRTFSRDRRTLLALILQVPVMAVLVTTLFPAGVLALPPDEPGKSAQFLFLLITVAIWLGLISATREIVKERSIMRREFAIGVGIPAYLASKLPVLATLTTVQVALLTGIAFAIQPMEGGGAIDYALAALILLGCAWAAVSMGLAISAVAGSVDQATSFVPLLLIPQLLFAGAVVPYESMQGLGRVASLFVVASWGFASIGNVAGMSDRLAASPPDLETFGDDFFDLAPAAGLVAAGLFVVAGLLLASALLSRQRRSRTS